MENPFTNDTGFFQRGKSFGGKGIKEGLKSVFKNIGKKFKSKPCEGQPGVCPYSCKPLQSETEKQTGVADEITEGKINPNGATNMSPLRRAALDGTKSQLDIQAPAMGANPITGGLRFGTPEAMNNPFVKQQLQEYGGF